MNNLKKRLTLLASLTIVLGLMLGLTVVGCSDKDRDSNSAASSADITYTFAQTITPGKATVAATQVDLTAYNAQGTLVLAKQTTTDIGNHKDVTPAGTVGTKYYQGAATVSAAATKLVLTYYDAEGKEVGTPDIHYVSNLQEGADIDFTEEATVVIWTPAEKDIRLSVDGDSVAVSAKDAEGTALTVSLDSEDEEHITIKGNTVAGKMATDKAVAMTATAKDSAGNTVGDMTYSVTVVDQPTPSTIVWDPAVVGIDLTIGGEAVTVTAKDEDETQLSVVLESEDKDHIDITDGNVLSGKAATEEAVTVTAKASDSQGKVVGTRDYLVVVKPQPVVVWSPEGEKIELVELDKGVTVTAEDEEGTPLTVALESDDKTHISIDDDATITGTAATSVPVTVTASVTVDGQTVSKEYSVSVAAAQVSWNPSGSTINFNSSSESVTITASAGATPLKVELGSSDPRVIIINGDTVSFSASGGDSAQLSAKAYNGKSEVGTTEYMLFMD